MGLSWASGRSRASHTARGSTTPRSILPRVVPDGRARHGAAVPDEQSSATRPSRPGVAVSIRSGIATAFLILGAVHSVWSQPAIPEKPIESAGILSVRLYSVRRLPLQPHEPPRELYHHYPVLGSTKLEARSTIAGIIGQLNSEIIPSVKDHCAFDARYGVAIAYKTKTVDYLMSSGCSHGFEFDHDKVKRTFSLRQPSSTSKTLDQYLLKAGVPLEPLPSKPISIPPGSSHIR